MESTLDTGVEDKYADNHSGWDVPLNAITVTLTFSSMCIAEWLLLCVSEASKLILHPLVILSMIILGSPVAFFTLGALCNSALYASYIICTGCMAWRRLSGEPMLPSRFSLGHRFGLFCNLT
jgi:hypothetical protein